MSIEKHSSAADARPARGWRLPHGAKVLSCLFLAALLAGCAHRYDMALTNGGRITNVSKPVFDKSDGVWYYKDVAGKVHHVSGARVVEIKPHTRKNTMPGTLQQ